jgi:hypothetical protein
VRLQAAAAHELTRPPSTAWCAPSSLAERSSRLLWASWCEFPPSRNEVPLVHRLGGHLSPSDVYTGCSVQPHPSPPHAGRVHGGRLPADGLGLPVVVRTDNSVCRITVLRARTQEIRLPRATPT